MATIGFYCTKCGTFVYADGTGAIWPCPCMVEDIKRGLPDDQVFRRLPWEEFKRRLVEHEDITHISQDNGR